MRPSQKHRERAKSGRPGKILAAQSKLSAEAAKAVNPSKAQGNLSLPIPSRLERFGGEPKQSDFEKRYIMQDKVLGTGSSGSVQAATCRRTGRDVAVKSFAKDALGEKCLTNLRREMDIQGSISHPNIVSCLDMFENEHFVHIVMERLSGGELFDHVQNSGRLSEREAAALAAQTLSAVAHLHEAKVIHRDLKPENLVFEKLPDGGAGGTPLLKLIDFGLSTRMAGAPLSERCGTLQYVAPEVLADAGYDEKADMWSLGCLFYSLLIGKMPFSGSEAEVARKTQLGAVEFSRSFRALSPEARSFVRSLLDPCPALRASAAEALQHPWIRGGGVQEKIAASPVQAQLPVSAEKDQMEEIVPTGFAEGKASLQAEAPQAPWVCLTGKQPLNHAWRFKDLAVQVLNLHSAGFLLPGERDLLSLAA